MNNSKKQEEMLLINEEQKAYYDALASSKKKDSRSQLTQIWANLRRFQQSYRKEIGINERVNQLHRKWIDQVASGTVLDLGCYRGNNLSLDIAAQSQRYLGIDLSEKAIEQFKIKISKKDLPQAQAMAVDFLAPDFQDKYINTFDLIYAKSVVHHFEHLDTFLQKLASVMVEGGHVITFDPMETFWPMRLIRAMYRPFQSDSEWEWPFRKKTFTQIQQYFDIVELQGVMGRSKNGLIPYLFNKEKGRRIGQRLLEKDNTLATALNSELWNCMQVTMLLRKKARL